MNPGPARDRLAVWTYVDAGEEIPCGDPSVTDAERAAAGQETIADRRRALLPANRGRADRQYSAGGLADGQDVVRVWQPRDPAALRGQVAQAPGSGRNACSGPGFPAAIRNGSAGMTLLVGPATPRRPGLAPGLTARRPPEDTR